MGFPAARVMDLHVCPMFTGLVPHVGGPIIPPAGIPVFIGNLPAARIGDLCTCVGPPDVIAKGSSGVFIVGKPAARILDNTVHGGLIVVGMPTVLIGETAGGGGPATLSPTAARGILGEAAFPGQQNFGNCGVQSVGEIIFLATGERVSEGDLLREALDNGIANPGDPSNPSTVGGTSPAQRQALLERHGVSSHATATDANALGDALREGRGVIVNVDAGTLWGNDQHGGHAVVVTDGTFDDDGNLATVIVNDTGNGTRQVMPASTLLDAADARPGGSTMNITDNPLFVP